jgi:non-specific serine/threonine protein kinase/serine/threonine-protein kinase
MSTEEPPDPAHARGPDQRTELTQAISPEETAGAMIGRYHLLQKIGEGGMGEVWLAEQKEPVRRRVAVKLIKTGMSSREVISRFESERQALALMDHPAIAKVLDAGSTPQGAPYFVMEYVAGVPITTYCDNHRLGTRDRLELFMHVCEGVQHAHQKAIIHRDLKPSNILVTEVDGHPAPKIIDFGVAKALTQKLTADTLFTRVGAMIGTPEYMSPEQALSSGEDIDTRTDVYSLGIILYELLAGAPPIELRKVALDEFLRRLRDDDPVKPSTKIRTLEPATSTDVARKRQIEPPALAKLMRGDLDSIALKALEKDRARRYGSPSDFAADINRYLKNEAVLAVPPSAGYRAGKFARRYRGALVTACAFVLVLLVAAVISTSEAVVARRAEARAHEESSTAQAVNDFLRNDLLAQASAYKQSAGSKSDADPDLKVRTALDRAAERIDGKFTKQPEVEAAIRQTVGQTYFDLGLPAQARKQLERALELRTRVLGPASPKTVETMLSLGRTADFQDKFAEAETIDKQALEISRRVLGPDHPLSLDAMNGLAAVYSRQGKYSQAEVLSTQALAITRRVMGSDHPQTLDAINNLAMADSAMGKYSQAEALDKQALEISRRVLGPDHPQTLGIMRGLASDYDAQGKEAESDEITEKLLEIVRRIMGPDHPDTLTAMYNVTDSYLRQGKYVQAEALASQALEIKRRVDSPESRRANSMEQLASAYRGQHKYAQAETLETRVLEIRRRDPATEDYWLPRAMVNLAIDYQLQGKYTQAEKLYDSVLELRRRKLGPEKPDTLAAAGLLAICLSYEKEYAKAKDLLQEAIQKASQSSEQSSLALAWYNSASVEAVAAHKDVALEYLRKAADLGSRDVLTMASDENLKSLRGDPRFAALIAKANEKDHAAAEQASK